MAARRTPTATPAAGRVALLVGLGLVALAVVAVRDLAVDRGWASGRPWLDALADRVGTLAPSTGLAVLGAAVAVVGLVLVVVALLPARRTHVALGEDGLDTWITPRAVAALARAVADRSAGVVEARTDRVSRQKVRIVVTPAPALAAAGADAETTGRAAQQDVDGAMAGLSRPVVTVRAVAS